MACVNLRPQAQLDIQEIWEFIAGDSIASADRWIDELDAKMNLWATQPTMGRARDELVEGIRSLSFGKYVVFFAPLPNGIDVVRVIHGARDIDNTFAL